MYQATRRTTDVFCLLLLVCLATFAGAQQAQFVQFDTTTEGNWKGSYGADGFNVIGDSASSYPSYATVTPSGQSTYTWASPAADVRAPQKTALTGRVAATWYGSPFTIDINLTDGQVHQVAIYCIDWDSSGRNQTLTVANAQTGAVLDTRSLTSFQSGVYAIWNMSGHISIKVILNSGPSAVVSGLFFGSGRTPAAAGTLLTSDSSTQGTWKTVYGLDGYNVISNSVSYPAYATVTPSGQSSYTWSSSTSDIRALQKSSGSDRIAATWYSSTNFTVDLNLTDGNSHVVAIYFLDWDNAGRSELVDVLDNATGVDLDSRTVASFQNGRYLAWNLKGHVTMNFTRVSGTNAVASGIFFGAAVPLPSVTGLSPSSGPIGTSVTVSGANFGSSQGTSTVAFNGTIGTPGAGNWSQASIVVPVPTGAVTGPVTVTVVPSTTTGPTFTVLPAVTNINPQSGQGGSVLEVDGTSFGATQGSSTVSIGGLPPNVITYWSDTKIICEVPLQPVTGPVVVTAAGNASNNNIVFTALTTGSLSGTISNLTTGAAISGATVTLYSGGAPIVSTATSSSGVYTFSSIAPGSYSLGVSASGFSIVTTPPVSVNAGASVTESVNLTFPYIASVSPTSGVAGTLVTVSGTGFGALQGNSSIVFGGVVGIPTQWSNLSISVPVPSGANTSSIFVTVGGAQSNAASFVVGAAAISGLVTANGSGVSAATVQALQSNVLRASATTGSDGSYSINNLAPGVYDMKVTTSGNGTVVVTGVVVTSGNTTTQNFSLSAAQSLSGQVLSGSAAVSGATVAAYQGTASVATGATDSSGYYSLPGLAPGTYSVTASATGYSPQTLTGVVVPSGSNGSANFNLLSQGQMSYTYDTAGRLSSVVNSLSNTAQYNYDAVGNVTSIQTHASSQVSVVGFSPTSGIAGTTVTIYGTGFSSTASQNTVTFFNGVASVVSSATATRLVTTVPSGATTGIINVSTPTGNASTSSSFSVAGSSGLPTISGFSPQLASVGSSVTISGTNFDPVAVNNSLSVGISRTSTSSSTTTTVSTTLAGVRTSGHITVTTKRGSVTSAAYLFVPPPGYTTSQVGFTGQTSLGGQVTVSLTTANTIGLVVLDVSAGQGFAISTTSSFSAGIQYQLYDPYGNSIGSGTIPTGNSRIATSQHSSTAGTCTILILPGNSTGSVTLSPTSILPDVSVPIVINGAPVNLATTVAGQNGYATFSAVVGERLNLSIGTVTGGLGQSPIGILTPTLGTMWSGTTQSTSGWFWNTGVLTVAQPGNQKIYLYPIAPGGVTFTLTSVPADVTGSIAVDGGGVATSTTASFQSAYLTFAGSQGQRVNLQISNVAGSNRTAPLGILAPGGSTFWSGTEQASSGWYWNTGLLKLPSTGTFTLYLTPGTGSNGVPSGTTGATFTLSTVPSDVTGSISVDGGAVATSTSVPFQSAYLTFSGTQGQGIYLTINNTVGPASSAPVGIINPDGSTFFSGTAYSSSGWSWESGLMTLGQTGSYRVYLSPSVNGPNGATTQTFGATFALTSHP